jgi:hypothetical protein
MAERQEAIRHAEAPASAAEGSMAVAEVGVFMAAEAGIGNRGFKLLLA